MIDNKESIGGKNGEVYLTLVGFQDVALKKYVKDGDQYRTQYQAERDILKELKHPRIIRLYGYNDT
ncbi:hypothetical protein Tsubulata_022503, partial [Turnera subulata]